MEACVIVLSAWAAMTVFLALAWVPAIAPVKDVGLAGQFRFLRKPGPWLILGAVFTGNAGVFCWWSYVSPWLQKTGGYDSDMVPFLMMLAGFGMVVGGIIGGRITDNWRHAGTAALGQTISGVGLLLVFLVPGNHVTTAIFTFWIAFGLFFNLRPTAAADGRGRRGRRRADGRRRRADGVQFRQCGRLDRRRAASERRGDELPFHRIGRRADQLCSPSFCWCSTPVATKPAPSPIPTFPSFSPKSHLSVNPIAPNPRNRR